MKKRLLTALALVSILLSAMVTPVSAETTTRYNYVGPWVWVPDGADRGWYPPDGTLGSIDLRSLPQMASPVDGGGGWGFFVTDRELPAPYVLLSTGDKTVALDNAVLTVRSKAIENKWNIKLEAITVRGIVWELLTQEGDLSGLVRWKPLDPDVNGVLRLELGGYSLVDFVKDDFSGREFGEKMGSWRNTVGN